MTTIGINRFKLAADRFDEIQHWCVDNISQMREGWDVTIPADRYDDLDFMFDNDQDATMFALKWVQ